MLDEPTNDLDVETLDLLQELIDDYDGTVLLVSHDRDFLDRVATTTIAMEGDGRAVAYAGGWSDYQAQKAVAEAAPAGAERPKPQAVASKPGKAVAGGLSFTQTHRLNTLPAFIAKLEGEVAKLNAALSDPALYAKQPAKFAKFSEGLVERQSALHAAEEEWLQLARLAES